MIGERLKNAMEKESVFPEEFVKLFASGDEVGDVQEVSKLLSELYGKMASRKISILLAYLEPTIVIFLAIVVGSFIISTLLPIINLSVK
jgi:type II secretory pathway component PulF